MNVEREKICYNALSRVFSDGAYSSIALNEFLDGKCAEREFITRLFYGVLERNITLQYIIDRLAEKKPKSSVSVILKMGIYMIRYMDVADYAAVDKCVELAKILGKGGVSGFVNAVLRKAKTVNLPASGEVPDYEYLSVNYGLPVWLSKKLIKQYSTAFVEDMMRSEELRTHIRLNAGVDTGRFESELSKTGKLNSSKTEYGYYVTHNTIKDLTERKILSARDYAVQSFASTVAVHCYADGLKENSRVLDLCAAPGGKSVYLAGLADCVPIACDIHEHRLNLIRSYANRMGVKVEVVENDACVFREDWSEKFDCVICDVPCSGSGDLRSKPDILLRRDAASVDELSKLQTKILRCASRYVKTGGKLCYSTCSILREENENVVESFLAHNSDYKTVDCSRFGTETAVEGAMLSDKKRRFVRLFPHTHATDGFFVAVMKKCGKEDMS